MIQLLLSFTSVHKPVSFVDDINFWISQNVLELNRDESESGCRCGRAKKKTVKVYTSGTRGEKKELYSNWAPYWETSLRTVKKHQHKKAHEYSHLTPCKRT